MCLVAGDGTTLVCPFGPLFGEVMEQHVAQGFTVIAYHHSIAIQELRELILQFISVIFLEFCQEGRSPVGAIHLVAVIEEGMRIWSLRCYEGAVDVLQIISHGSRVEVVDYIAFSSRSSTFHLLSGTALIEGDDSFLVFFSFHRECLDDLQLGEGTFFLWHVEFYLHQFLFHIHDGIYEHRLACCFADRHPRTTERPTCSCSHIGFNAHLLVFLLYKFEHVHPFRREIRDIVLVVALHTIEGCDFYGTDTRLGVFAKVPLQVLLIHSRSHPPPSYARFGFLRRGREQLCLAVE